MRFWYLLLCITVLSACKPGRKVNTSFYYWKTVYRQNPAEDAFIHNLHSQKLYIRIMDIDVDDDGVTPVPISPVTFQNKPAANMQLIPVVYIVNDVLRKLSHPQMDQLANNIIRFVDAKIQQAGKLNFAELQIDCDWTGETRNNYFYLLRRLKVLRPKQTLSVTLRLHQVKNQKASGIPPADKVLLMCYNMGNLRKYGTQNSIIELSELKKYLGNNLGSYPMAMDVALPLFSWAVAFRNKDYIGIDKRINLESLNQPANFRSNGNNLYSAKTDLPALGLQKNDEVRWEGVDLKQIQDAAAYISRWLKPGELNIVWFHLDEAIVKKYKYEDLQNAADLLR